ncbi:putative reverse transcriptase domain-containing protein [Tanacetum coccineum]
MKETYCVVNVTRLDLKYLWRRGNTNWSSYEKQHLLHNYPFVVLLAAMESMGLSISSSMKSLAPLIVYIPFKDGTMTSYALASSQERGQLFIKAGAKVYKGQIVGIHQRPGDLSLNVCKKKVATIKVSTKINLSLDAGNLLYLQPNDHSNVPICVVELGMVVVHFHCPFVGLSGFQDGGRNGLAKTLLITHLHDRHCNGDVQAITRQSLSTNLAGSNFVSPPDCGDGVVRFVLYDLTKPHVPSSSEQLDHVDDLAQVMRETLAESSPLLSDVDEEEIDLGEQNIKQSMVLDIIKSFPHGTSYGRDGLRNAPNRLGEYIVSAPLTPLVKPGGGISPTDVGTVWRHLAFKFGVGVAGESEAILHSVNHLIEACGDDVSLLMLLEDFKNTFNLVDREVMLHEVRLRCPAISCWVKFYYSNPARLYYGEHALWPCQGVQQGDPLGPLLFSLVLHPLICKIRDSFSLSLHAWYLDDGTIVGDTVVVGKVLELIMKDGPGCGMHLNVDKTEVFWPKEDPRSRLAGIFPPNIARPLHGVKLLGEPASVDFDFCNELVLKRVAKTIGLMDDISKINDPQCEFILSLLLDQDLAIGNGGLPPYLSHLGGLTMLLRHTGIVSLGPIFDNALSVFNTSMETDLLSNPSEIAAPKLMKKMADIYFTWVTKNVESTFSLSPQQMAVWTSQREDHTSDWLRTVPISRVFVEDIYRDHAVSCAGIIGIKHHHNVVCDTLVEICYRSWISAGKKVDIGLDRGRDKPLRPVDMVLYSWDGGLDVCVDLIGSLPLTQTGIDVAQRKRGKYMAKCAAIRYGFLPFSFSSLGELEADAVTLLKRIRKFPWLMILGYNGNANVSQSTSTSSGSMSFSFTNEQKMKLLSLINEKPATNVYGSLLLNVGHPNGTLAKITAIGSLKLTNNVVLFNVLVVLKYNDLKLAKIMGTGSESGGLYMFDYIDNGKYDVGVCNSGLVCHVSKDFLHCRLGHPADQLLSILGDKLRFKTSDHVSACDICHKAK